MLKSAAALLLFGLLLRVSAAKKTEILDQEGDSSNIETIAQAVCEITRGADKQISQISTISRLVQFFHSINPDHHLAACAQHSLPAFDQMQLILGTSNEDVCASAKIELIERFHRNFISKVRKYRKEQKANNLSVPKLLKLFYMHYASAVSATCEQAASRDLSMITFTEADRKEESEATVTQLEGIFGKLDSRRGYKDMHLLWNFIDTLPLEKDAKLSRYLHQGNIRLVLQMNNVEKFVSIQDVCRNKLKPFYSRSLLPVIRLVDLGFYPENQQLAQILSSSPNFAHLYTVTQMCETFLRIQVVQNESLNPDQIVVLSKDDAEALDLIKNIDAEIIKSNSKNQVDSITSVENDESQQFIKKVKANVNSRVREHSRILRNLIKRIKGESSKDSSQFILSDGSQKDDLKSLLSESLLKIDQSDPLRPIEGYDESDESDQKAVVRSKRSVFGLIKTAVTALLAFFFVIGYVITWSVLHLLKLVIIRPILFIWNLIPSRSKSSKNSSASGEILSTPGSMNSPPK